MESTLSNAVTLSLIGMFTVFMVLLLVVIVGGLLIKLVNKYAKVPVIEPRRYQPIVSGKKVAAITSVVEHLTQGRGKIESIEKL